MLLCFLAIKAISSDHVDELLQAEEPEGNPILILDSDSSKSLWSGLPSSCEPFFLLSRSWPIHVCQRLDGTNDGL
jgi:hypothetical protein